MTNKISILPPDLAGSLAELLGEIVFSPIEAASVHNRHWRATVLPQEASDGKFDALVTILPRSGNETAAVDQTIETKRTDALGSVDRETTNDLGQAWFRGLEPGSYGLRFSVENVAAFPTAQYLKAAASMATPEDLAKEPELD